jgi:hypothetical protein
MDRMDEPADALLVGVDAALGGWVERCVRERAEAWSPALAAELSDAARRAGEAARAATVPRLRALLAADVDEQKETPLTLIRAAVRFPTQVLEAAGVPPVERDGFAVRAFPSDVYGLSPASLAEVDPALAELGFAWGAWKVIAHRRRHGPR